MSFLDQLSLPVPAVQQPKTLDQARRELRARLVVGTVCPCCDRAIRMYKRKLHSSMALALILIYKQLRGLPTGSWCHVPSLLSGLKVGAAIRGGDYAKLCLWGLLEGKRGLREDGSKRIGYYRLTERGVLFVQNKASAPRHLLLLNNEVVDEGEGEPMVTIVDALGDGFSYHEMMA